jgi:hypothetical protein
MKRKPRAFTRREDDRIDIKLIFDAKVCKKS